MLVEDVITSIFRRFTDFAHSVCRPSQFAKFWAGRANPDVVAVVPHPLGVVVVVPKVRSTHDATRRCCGTRWQRVNHRRHTRSLQESPAVLLRGGSFLLTAQSRVLALAGILLLLAHGNACSRMSVGGPLYRRPDATPGDGTVLSAISEARFMPPILMANNQ